LYHIFHCEEVRRRFGRAGDFEEKVDVLCKIKRHFEKIEEEHQEFEKEKKFLKEVRESHQ